ncbi:MAG: hypothetical protein N2690_02940 [Rhodocyclaceae bacterium]|nr:hypothetical protein [Rhodocyclaceae bacterium]
MKLSIALCAAGLLLGASAWAGQDFHCMQGCLGQGYDRNYCLGVCSTAAGAGGMLDQPGLPKNPAFEQVQPNTPRQPLPKIADPQCMKDCQRRGYDYMFCYKKMCAYSTH